MPDDYSATTQTTGAVTVGNSTTGEIEVSGDHDWFEVALEAGKTYRIDLEGDRTDNGTLWDPYLRGVQDADGNLLPFSTNDDGGEGRNSQLFFTPDATGTYYVAAGAWSFATGTYKLSVTDVTAGVMDDYASGTGTAGTVAVDSSAAGEIDFAGDRDWFEVTLAVGKTYRIDLEGSSTGEGTLRDPYLRGIHDAAGDLVPGTTNNGGGDGRNSRVFFTAENDGTHYVAAGAWVDGTGTYRLSVTDVTDSIADIDLPGTVDVGASARGRIETTADVDWFEVTLEAGKTYRIDQEGVRTGKGSLYDPYLRGVHDADGVLIPGTTSNDGGRGYNSRVFFTPDADGVYHVAAGSSGTATGTYRLSVADVTDDHAAGTETAGMVAVNGSVAGRIEVAGDRDWFEVTLEAGKTYRIDLKGSPTGDGTLRDPFLRGVHDADGALIPGTANNNGGDDRNSRVFFTAEDNGTYYVAAGAKGSRTGTYTLSVTEFVDDSDDYAAGTWTTGTVAVDSSARGEIETIGDQDWFAVTLDAGKTYRVDLEGSRAGHGTLGEPRLYGVHDAHGRLIPGTTYTNGGDGVRESRVFVTVAEAGTYYVAAGGHPHYGNRTGTYRLSVTEVADDHPATAETTGTVAVGSPVTGEIQYTGDRDWFAVTLVEGTTYRIDLKGSPSGDGTLRDPYLRGLHDANGVLLPGTTNDDGGQGDNSQLSFTAAETGTYYIAAGAGSGTGTYTLSVTAVDHAATVAIDGSTTGEIEVRGERDWFAVSLEAGKTYRIDLKGSPSGDGTLRDPYLRGLHDANGVLLPGTTNNDGGEGRNSQVFFTADDNGTYYVAAGAQGSRTGTYTLSVADVTDDYAAGTETTGTVAVGSPATGEIEVPRDRDWFAVTLEEGKTYRIDLKGSPTGDGTLSNPHLHGVYDSTGALISGTTNDNGGVGSNSRVIFTPAETGTYYVGTGAWAGRSGSTGTYTLSVADVTDDYAAGIETTGTVAVGASETGVIEVLRDTDWFAVTLQADKMYRIDLEGVATGKGTLSDPFLFGIRDSTGTHISYTSDNDGGEGTNSRDLFTPDADGTYYVVAGAHPAVGNRTGTYTLSVTDVTPPSDDYAAGIETTGMVAVGDQVTGESESPYDDRDWFAVTLVAGQTYRIDLEGVPTGKGTLPDPYLFGIRDSTGTHISYTSDDDDGEGDNSRLFFTPDANGTYYVVAGSHPGVGIRTGTYTLSVTDVTTPADDYAAGIETTGMVAVDDSVTGELQHAGDSDWFAVTLQEGKTYRIDLEGAPTSKGTLSDPYLRGIFDSDGDRIRYTSNDDGGQGENSRLDFTASEDGTYYVAAGAIFRSDTGTYTLSVEEVM